MHDFRNGVQSHQTHVSQLNHNAPHTIRAASAAVQNQQPFLMNGITQMHTFQSYPFDPTSAPALTQNSQYISPQLLPHLQAHLAAVQKAGDIASQQPHSLHRHDLSLPNQNLVNVFRSTVPEGVSAPGTVMGSVRSGLPSALPSSSNMVYTHCSSSQQGEPLVDRGSIGTNRSSNATASLILSVPSKASHIIQTSQKLAGSMAQSLSEQAESPHFKQAQRFLRSSGNSNDSRSNASSTDHAVHQHLQAPQFSQPPPQQLQSQGQRFGFTRQQLVVLKSQILAFRRLKRGERTLPLDDLHYIGPPPFTSQQYCNSWEGPAGAERDSGGPGAMEVVHALEKRTSEHDGGTSSTRTMAKKVEITAGEISIHEEKKQLIHADCLVVEADRKIVVKEECEIQPIQRSDSIAYHDAQTEPSLETENTLVKPSPLDTQSAPEIAAAKKLLHSQKVNHAVRRYRGPLYDFPPVAKKVDGRLLALNNPLGRPITIAYDVRRLLLEEGIFVFRRKRAENLKFLDALLSSSNVRKGLPADLVLKSKIEQRKLRLLKMQAKIREEVEQEQQEIMAMGERGYRKFVRLCERQRAELARQAAQLQKTTREKLIKALSQWRKRLLEAHWAIRDCRSTRNKGVAKYHERMLREYSKRRDEDRNKRMEALKNNDVDMYREMLKQQQNQLTGDAGQRYEVLSSFLTQTEDYLQSLGGKISAVKVQQERKEAAFMAAVAAQGQGLSEEEIQAAASQAMKEVEARNQPLEFHLVSVNKYYNLAHAVSERVVRQPSMLRAGILRDYQLVGLQWMLSLYNNHLNGILADEMGLGKTVQVMALIAYLMEFKGNNGPHLIIVPNAVIVNWKSELYRWLPSVSCIFYVGAKEYRAKLYTQDICAMKFNVLVTTYEFIMRDRAKLCKVDWKYLIIDEAQRMKDRESRLARDLDRFRCQRRLLLTGTPLQNELKELWSLLNLLLPEVFDNSKVFHDWFSTPFQKDSSSQNSEDDWLETEKKIIVIHRLHQILEPFMLRRRVEDVEGSLPQKVPVVVRCRMSALQAAIYDWIRITGTIRLDPDEEAARVALRNGKRQMRAYTPLQNKCMELRKACNHPFLNYPSLREYFNNLAVRSCGKLWMLDRILVKFHRSSHRVLLFSTMTKLLDILEDYFQWRGFIFRRIDGTTTLESRESAINDFNRPGSDCFIFLLSIRAAGRGLNLQSADTVIIYDPDPNPKNEEQAVARAHRIGQKREVRVLYMEAVVETISSYQKEDELRSGGTLDVDDEMAGKDRYVGSVESLVRNTIQQFKIDMADEIINAGRFDQQTTQEERRLTLEALLHDEERYQERLHDVPSMQEVNHMIARSEEEMEFFDQIDDEYDWPGELLQHHEIPKWLRVGSQEVKAATKAVSKQASKKIIVESFGTVEEEKKLLAETLNQDRTCNLSHTRLTAKGKKSLSKGKNSYAAKEQTEEECEQEYLHKIYMRKDEETEEEHDQGVEIEVSSDEEEDGEIREEIEDDEDGDQLATEQEGQLSEEEQQLASTRDNPTSARKGVFAFKNKKHEEQTAASEFSHGEDDEAERAGFGAAHSPSVQKFGSLAAIDTRPVDHPAVVDDLEEGEFVASGDSPFGAQASESSEEEEEEEEEEEQMAQPQIKRKRSARHIRKRPIVKLEERGCINYHDKKRLPADSHQYQSQRPNYKLDRQYFQFDIQAYEPGRQVGQRLSEETKAISRSPVKTSMGRRSDQWEPPLKRFHSIEPVLPSRKIDIFTLPQPRQQVSQSCAVPKHIKMTACAIQDDDAVEVSQETLNSKARVGAPPSCGGCTRMPDSTQKKCKTVLQKLLGAVNKEGRQIAILFELPKRNELPGYYKRISNPIDAHTIEQHLDRFDYGSVLEFAADVQLMLDNAARYYNSADVKADARRLQALFFQRMGLNFPDVDFGSVKTRSLATSSQLVKPALSSPRQQSVYGIAGNLQAHRAAVEQPSANAIMAEENVLDKKEEKRLAKDSKVRSAERALERDKARTKPENELDALDDNVCHPVDLLFCRKKRKDRGKVKKVKTIGVEKTSVSMTGSSMKLVSHQINKGTEILKVHVKDAKERPTQKLQGLSQAGIMKGNKAAVEQWLTPVKKTRTDGGKRRPSHL